MPDDLRPHLSPPAGDMIARRVRARLVAGRCALGLEPELLDVVCGLRRGTVARLEAGQRRVTPLHLLRLATVLDVGIDWFFSETPLVPSHVPVAATAGRPGYQEMAQFLAVFTHLGSDRIRAEIRGLVQAVANRACSDPEGGLPVEEDFYSVA